MKILFVASESVPFIKSGGLGDVIGSLPASLVSRDCEVACIIPLHEGISQEMRDKMEFVTSIFVPVAWRNQYCGIFKLVQDKVTWYFIDNEYYFRRGRALYGCYDDAERFAFFGNAALTILPIVDYCPDVIHCHDWQTALVPVYLRTIYAQNPFYSNIKSIITIHNIEYQGVFGREIMENVLGIDASLYDNGTMRVDEGVNLLKSAIVFADKVTTVSPTYAEEIKTREYGHGLDGVLRLNAGKLSGIVNGIDVKLFDPKTDKHLFAPYSKTSMSGKKTNKGELQKLLNLPQKQDTPLIAVITRMVAHKGMDLITSVLDELLEDDVQLVVLGTGDWQYEQFLRDKQWQYPSNLSVNIAFNADLAQKIYAASDIFLMPSLSEPCGLAQMIALRYGSIPIVRETGGLRDTVTPYNKFTGEGRGFTFHDYNAHDMLYVIREAEETYADKEAWSALSLAGMKIDFSWKKSAKEYKSLYEALII